MEEYIQKFSKYTKLNESISTLTEEVEVKEYKVKDKHKAEDRLEELGIDWKDLIDHPDGTGFGKDGNLMAHYDEDDGKLYVHVESENGESSPTRNIDIEDVTSDSYISAMLNRYSDSDGEDEDENWDIEPSDSDLKDFDEF